MRNFIFVVLLLAAAVGVGGYVLGWYTVAVDQNKVKKDRDAVIGVFQPPKEAPGTDEPVDQGKIDHDEIQQRAETQFTAMDLSLLELKAKAKSGEAVTKESMNQTINDLAKKTEIARGELRDLKASARDQWSARRTQLGVSLGELKVGLERAFSQYMNEHAGSTPERAPAAGPKNNDR